MIFGINRIMIWAMNTRLFMRRVVLFSLMVATLVASGCSYRTDLVVVNLSDKPVEVRYRFRSYPNSNGDFHPPDSPAIKTANELNDDVAWRNLTTDQYIVDSSSRSVRLTLPPRTALRMISISGPGVAKERDDPSFPLTELVVSGANGVVMLQGEQVRKSFNEETRQTYSIVYR